MKTFLMTAFFALFGAFVGGLAANFAPSGVISGVLAGIICSFGGHLIVKYVVPWHQRRYPNHNQIIE